MEPLNTYFDREMKEEFHVAFARREAAKIVRNIEYHKAASLLEKHVDMKYSVSREQLVGA